MFHKEGVQVRGQVEDFSLSLLGTELRLSDLVAQTFACLASP